MIMSPRPNHPAVVWGSCFLWHISVVTICWSLLLFFCIGDILLITGMDVINAIVLLSGLIMLPTNIRILYDIANGNKIDYKSKVLCCPLRLCIVWIIIINFTGVVLCGHKILVSRQSTIDRLRQTIKYYRSVPRFKHFVDNMQWSLKCCGINSYRDWFDHNWYDKIRDYDWIGPQKNRRPNSLSRIKLFTDSVPLSCCKSGSCIANYLLELGTSSINTRGCADVTRNILLAFMLIHIILFLSVIVVETQSYSDLEVRNIMSMKNNFNASSASLRTRSIPDDSVSDEFERDIKRSVTARHTSYPTLDVHRDFTKIDDEGPETPNEAGKSDNY